MHQRTTSSITIGATFCKTVPSLKDLCFVLPLTYALLCYLQRGPFP